MSLRELPYTAQGHRTYNITQLNTFIKSQRERVLNFYTAVFSSVDMNSIKVPSLTETRNYADVSPRVPREMIEATLMRVNDVATLIRLVQAQFFEDWQHFQNFESGLDLGGEFAITKNPPDELRAKVHALKNSKRKAVTQSFSSDFHLRSGVTQELNKTQLTNLDFWTEDNLKKYQELYQRFTQTTL